MAENHQTLFAIIRRIVICLVIVVLSFLAIPSGVHSPLKQDDEAMLSVQQADNSVAATASVVDSSQNAEGKEKEEVAKPQEQDAQVTIVAERTNNVSRGANGLANIKLDAKQESAVSIIVEAAVSAGCTQQEIDMLLYIAFKESSFCCDAVSPGGECIGFYQLSSDKGTLEQRLDPYWNTDRAIRYMKERYGSIRAAYSFRKAHNWY